MKRLLFAALLAGVVLGLCAWTYQQLPMTECAWCHAKRRLNRHHVIPQATAPEMRDVRTNLVVLCRTCHYCIGHRCNWRRYNPDVLTITATFTNCVVNERGAE